MPVPTFTGLGPDASKEEIVNKVNVLVKELRNLLLSLDDANFTSITAKVIDVDQLSAISADLGEMTAGKITGGIVQTKVPGSYPRVALNSTTNLIEVEYDATHKIAFNPFISDPTIEFTSGSATASLGFVPFNGFVIGTNSDIKLNPTGNVKVPDWAQLYSNGDAQTLQTALDTLTTNVAGKATTGASTGSVGTHNHGIPDGTVLMVNGGGTVTFSASGGHSHTQT